MEVLEADLQGVEILLHMLSQCDKQERHQEQEQNTQPNHGSESQKCAGLDRKDITRDQGRGRGQKVGCKFPGSSGGKMQGGGGMST